MGCVGFPSRVAESTSISPVVQGFRLLMAMGNIMALLLPSETSLLSYFEEHLQPLKLTDSIIVTQPYEEREQSVLSVLDAPADNFMFLLGPAQGEFFFINAVNSVRGSDEWTSTLSEVFENYNDVPFMQVATCAFELDSPAPDYILTPKEFANMIITGKVVMYTYDQEIASRYHFLSRIRGLFRKVLFTNIVVTHWLEVTYKPGGKGSIRCFHAFVSASLQAV